MKTSNYIVGKISRLPNTDSMELSIKKILQIMIFSTALMLSSTAFACEGESLEQTKVLVNNTKQMFNQILMGLDFNQIMQKILKINQIALQLPPSCQQAFQQWMQAFNAQMGGLSGGGFGGGGGGGPRCMSGVCCDSTGCY